MRWAWVCIGLATLIRLVYVQGFLLVPDETNYWQWGRHLDWGYHDQAPMIAWTIRLATFFLGHGELTVRLPSVVAMAVASVYLVLLSRQWFGAQVAMHTALMSNSIFIFNVGGLLATADGLQGVAWLGAAYHGARAIETGHWRQWLGSGAWFGFGMLSKFTVVLFLPCIVAYVVFSKRHRHYLKSIKPYCAYALGSLLFFPVIIWNAGHNWNSVRHVAYIGGADKAFHLHLNLVFEFILSQAGLLTPVVFSLLIAGWLRLIRFKLTSSQWIYSFLGWTSLPIVAGFTLLNLHSRVYANWACFGYLTAMVLMGAIYAPKPANLVHAGAPPPPPPPVSTVSVRWWYSAMGVSYALTGLVLLQVIFPIIPLPAKYDRIAKETLGWDALGRQVAQIHQSMPDSENTFIFGLKYQIASELAFYVPGQPQTVSINRWDRPNVYDYWWQEKDLLGRDGLGCIQGEYLQRLLTIFDRVEFDSVFQVHSSPGLFRSDFEAKPLKTFYIYRCYGFKGGLRWVPPNRNDIRRIKTTSK